MHKPSQSKQKKQRRMPISNGLKLRSEVSMKISHMVNKKMPIYGKGTKSRSKHYKSR